jgi:hypothetical protein
MVLAALALVGCDPFPSFDGFASSTGGRDASGSSDGGLCDADLSTSSSNCGVCGHGCFGGGCASGQCLPVALVSGEPFPYGVAIDDTRVYWAQYVDGGSVRSIEKTGDASTLMTVVPDLPYPQYVAVDDANVYVTNVAGPVMSAPKGGAASATVLTPSYAGLHDLALDDSVVYYSNRESSGGIYFVPKDGGAPTEFAVADQPGSIAIDTQNVYWVEFGPGTNTGRVSSRAKGNPDAPLTLYSNEEDFPDGIAIDTSNIYWTHFVLSGGVSKVPINKSAAVFLLNTDVATTNGIATDGTDVFFTSYSMGNVNRVPSGGGPTVTLAEQTIGNPIRIAVDTTFIYWTADATAGIVYRLAK